MEEFKKADIEKILDIDRMRVQEWLRRGLIKPLFQAPSRGFANLFNRFDLYMVKLLKYLIDCGHTRKKAGGRLDEIVMHVKKHKLENKLPNYFVIGDKFDENNSSKRFLKISQFQTLERADLTRFKGFGHVLIIDFKKIKDEVDSRIKAFS